MNLGGKKNLKKQWKKLLMKLESYFRKIFTQCKRGIKEEKHRKSKMTDINSNMSNYIKIIL
jgi:hypothetical protein